MMNTDNDTTGLMRAFDFNSHPVRVVERDGAPWFVAADVCRVLDLSNPSKVCGDLDEDETMTLTTSEGHSGQRGGAQFLNVISESGLYALVFKSRKPEAKVFRRWVTSEVLPAIRQTGAYAVGGSGDGLGMSEDRESILRFVRGCCAGWPLERQLEFGLAVRRFAKGMGVVFETAVEPGVGRVLVFPKVVLEEVRKRYTTVTRLPDSDAVEFEKLLLTAVEGMGAEGQMSCELLRGLAKTLSLFPGIFGPNTSLASERSGFGKLAQRFNGLRFPSGVVLTIRRRSDRVTYFIKRDAAYGVALLS